MAAQTAVKHHFLFMLLLGDALFYLMLTTKDCAHTKCLTLWINLITQMCS